MLRTIRLIWPFALAELLVRLAHDFAWRQVVVEWQEIVGILSLVASVTIMFALGVQLRSKGVLRPYVRATWSVALLWLLSAVAVGAVIDVLSGGELSVGSWSGHVITFAILLPLMIVASYVGVFLRGRVGRA